MWCDLFKDVEFVVDLNQLEGRARAPLILFGLAVVDVSMRKRSRWVKLRWWGVGWWREGDIQSSKNARGSLLHAEETVKKIHEA